MGWDKDKFEREQVERAADLVALAKRLKKLHGRLRWHARRTYKHDAQLGALLDEAANEIGRAMSREGLPWE